MKKKGLKHLAFFAVMAATLAGSALTVFASAEPTFGQKMAQAGRNTIIGLVTVFIILLVLSFLISLFKYIAPKKKVSAKKTTTEFVIPKKAAAAAEDDTELIAVIMAAIAASEGETYDPTRYRLKSIKRLPTSRRWNRARRDV